MPKPKSKRGTRVATVIRLRDYDRRERDPPEPNHIATVVILPIIRIERYDLKSSGRKSR